MTLEESRGSSAGENIAAVLSRPPAVPLDRDDPPAGGDSMGYYLRDIRSLPLLTREQEDRLVREIDLARRGLVRAVAHTPQMLRALEAVRRDVAGGKLPPGKVLRTGVEMKRERLLELLPAAEKAVGLCAGHARKPGRNGSADSREKAVEAVERLNLRQHVFDGVAEEMARGAGGKCRASLKNSRVRDKMEAKELAEKAAAQKRRLTELKNRLVEHNLRLVISIAKKYARRGVCLVDLVQEGNIGLMKAVDRFDHRMGFKFGTYASWWIRQTVARAAGECGRTVRIPVYMADLINRITAASDRVLCETGREPSPDELSKRLGVSEEKIHDALSCTRCALPLEPLTDEDGEVYQGSFIEDRSSPAPSTFAARMLLKEQIDKVMRTLTDREREILNYRFGFKDGRPRTLEEVGEIFNVTRERIRQIEADALKKLRRPSRRRELRGFLDINLTEA